MHFFKVWFHCLYQLLTFNFKEDHRSCWHESYTESRYYFCTCGYMHPEEKTWKEIVEEIYEKHEEI